MNCQKAKMYVFFLVLISLFCFTATSYAQSVPKFLIMTEDWEPYNFQKDGVIKGISTDILVLMLEKVGSHQGRSDINLYSWARGYKLIQEKPNTILYTTTRTEERENMFKWVGPIFEIEFNLYALKSKHIKINSFKDLKKYKIGTLRGDVVEDLLVKKAGMKVTDFDQVASNLLNTKKLAIGRIDLVAQSNDTTLATCREAGLNPDDFESVFNLDKKSMYYAFNKQTPDSVIEIFQKAFDDLKAEGKVAEIFNSYGK